jgi:hypothetical protein
MFCDILHYHFFNRCNLKVGYLKKKENKCHCNKTPIKSHKLKGYLFPSEAFSFMFLFKFCFVKNQFMHNGQEVFFLMQ